MPSYMKQIDKSPYSLSVSIKFQNSDKTPNLRVTLANYKNGVRTTEEPAELTELQERVRKYFNFAGFQYCRAETIMKEQGFDSQGFEHATLKKNDELIELADRILRLTPGLVFQKSKAAEIRKQQQPAEPIEVRLRESLTRAMPGVASDTIDAAVAGLVADIPELTAGRSANR